MTKDSRVGEAGPRLRCLDCLYYMPASPALRWADVVRAAARSIREQSERHSRQGVLR